MTHARQRKRSTQCDKALLAPAGVMGGLFWLTAVMGVAVAYDRRPALEALGLLTAGLALAVALVWLGRRNGSQALGWPGIAMALAAGALGLYFMLAYSWTAGAGKIGWLQQLGELIEAHRPALALPEDVNANVAASGLLVTLFLGLSGWLWAVQQRLRAVAAATGLAWLLGLAALLLTQSRGAWLGALAGGAAMVYLALRRRWAGRRAAVALLDGLLVLAAIAGLAAFVLTLRDSHAAAVRLLGTVGASGVSRVSLWRDSLDLIGDYPLTGSGLRSTMMVYSAYELLIHVGFIPHMHNLFLQIAVEQGIAGLLAFVGLLGLAWICAVRSVHPGRRSWRFGLCAGGALAALAVHGMVDASVYANLLAPLLFLPAGFALALSPRLKQKSPRPAAWAVVGLAALAALAALVVSPAGRGMIQANLGTVAQTRAELAVYRWPEWPLPDTLRRAGAVDMGPIIARYRAALAENPRNAAANRRLGQIELALGDYAAARQHLQAAYQAAPTHRATRQLLAEAYAIDGDLPDAARLLSSLDLRPDQVQVRVFWYNSIGEPGRAELLQQAAALAAP